MLEFLVIGGGFAFAAAIQPGPLQAFLIARVATDGWRPTLPAALAPVISDVPIAAAVLLLLHTVARGLENALQAIGGVVYLGFAVATVLEWRRSAAGSPHQPRSSPRTLLQAVAVNLVNPGPYLGWSLILGPLALEAWPESRARALALVGGFYVVMVATLAAFILLVGTTTFLGARARQGLLLVSAAALAAIALYSIWSAFG